MTTGNRSAAVRRSWATRRRVYGPSGRANSGGQQTAARRPASVRRNPSSTNRSRRARQAGG